jgi:hypothetical protein
VTLLIAIWISLMAQAQAPASPYGPPRPELVLEQISCAPIGLPVPALATMKLTGGYVHGRIMYGPGDAVIVNAGVTQGVQKGQVYFVRRLLADASIKQPKVGALYAVHTAGWVTIVDVKENMAVGQVTHACDSLMEGDYLEPYVPPVPPSSALTGAPDYEHPGHIMLADEKRQTGYPGLAMLVDRGSEDGVRAGQILTIYRETLNGQGPIIDVGRAMVISVTNQSSLVRIESARDAVYLGDMVAIHRITQ